jgi:hypothetical protein
MTVIGSGAGRRLESALRDAVPQARDVVTERVVPGVARTYHEHVVPTVTDRVIPGVQHAVTTSVLPAVSGAVDSALASERTAELRRRYTGVVAAASGDRGTPAPSRWPFAVGAFVAGLLVGAAVAFAVKRPPSVADYEPDISPPVVDVTDPQPADGDLPA